MSVEQAVYDRIKDLVGGRVWANHRPQSSVRPALTYEVITGVAERSLTGHSGLVQYRVQIDAWADTYAEMITTLNAAIAVMRPHGTDFRVISEVRGPDIFESDTKIEHGVVDFVLWYPS